MTSRGRVSLGVFYMCEIEPIRGDFVKLVVRQLRDRFNSDQTLLGWNMVTNLYHPLRHRVEWPFQEDNDKARHENSVIYIAIL